MVRFPFVGPALAAAALACFPNSAEAKVVASGAGGFITNDTRVVDATPREVWLALIAPGEWWSSDHTWSGDAANMTITPQAGGCFCERIPAVENRNIVGLDGSARHMTVVMSSPDKVLRMRGGLGPLQSEPVDGVLTITIAPMEEGSRVTFEYVVGGFMRFDPAAISKAVDGVMTQQLEGLANRLGPLDDPDTAVSGAQGEGGIEEVDLPAAETDSADGEGESGEPAQATEPRISVDDAFGDIGDDD